MINNGTPQSCTTISIVTASGSTQNQMFSDKLMDGENHVFQSYFNPDTTVRNITVISNHQIILFK